MNEKKIPERLAIEGGEPVRKKPLPWELPGAHWIGAEELELVSKVINARSPFRYYGPDLQGYVDQLEHAFCRRYGRRYAVAVGSGTAALNIVFAALGIGPGDEVLLPGYLWVSCISAVVRLGAIPRMVDIDDTFCMCPQDLKKKIGPHTKAILFVHMSGAAGRIDEVAEIARKNGLKLVEDCAQANGAHFKGKPVGTFGDLALFSFQLNKNMTSGEGGMVVCEDEHLYKRVFAIHDLGYARDAGGRLTTTDERYQLWGTGSRMSELTAAMALAQEGKLDKITGAMRSAKWQIRKALEGTTGISFRNVIDPTGDSGPFLISIFKTPEKCRMFCEALKAEGINGQKGGLAFVSMEEWGLHWFFNNASLVNKRSLDAGGFPWSHPANAFAVDYAYARVTLPACDDLCSRSCLLTIASCLTGEDIEDIIAAYRKVAGHLLK